MFDQAGNVRTQRGAAALSNDTWAFMDVSTQPWQQYIVGAYQTLAQHGVDLLQFDSSMEAGPQICYNPTHSHPRGMGGNWQTQAWIDLVQKTQSAITAANPDATLSAESPAEVYLPYIAVYSSSAIDQYEQGSGSQISKSQCRYFSMCIMTRFCSTTFSDLLLLMDRFSGSLSHGT